MYLCIKQDEENMELLKQSREPSQDSNNRKEPAMQSVSLGKRNNKSLRQEVAWCVVERRPV